MPLSAARREQESARLGRELYIAEQKPSILKLGKAAIDEGGGMAHIQDQMWEQLPADGKQGYIAAARRKQHGEAAFELFEAELQPSISEASEDQTGLMGSGGDRVKRAMWEELSPAQQDGYVDIAAKKAREQSIAAARASPGKKKRTPPFCFSNFLARTPDLRAFLICTSLSSLDGLDLSQPAIPWTVLPFRSFSEVMAS